MRCTRRWWRLPSKGSKRDGCRRWRSSRATSSRCAPTARWSRCCGGRTSRLNCSRTTRDRRCAGCRRTNNPGSSARPRRCSCRSWTVRRRSSASSSSARSCPRRPTATRIASCWRASPPRWDSASTWRVYAGGSTRAACSTAPVPASRCSARSR